jgi:hypothetical protein
MSSAGPYLRSLRKSELTEFAEISDLKECVFFSFLPERQCDMNKNEANVCLSAKSYADLKKAELEVALDTHLRANSSIFSGEKRLSDYYRRLSQPPRVSSPVKKEPKAEASATSSTEEKRPSSRRRKTPVEACVSSPSLTRRAWLDCVY